MSHPSPVSAPRRLPLAIATRMRALEPSATLAMAARAQALAAAGVDVIDLSVGEPDFPTPDHICRAAEAAIHAEVQQLLDFLARAERGIIR